MRLKWHGKKYGKHVVDCNEAYTSKNRSWDGSIDDRFGASKVIKGNWHKDCLPDIVLLLEIKKCPLGNGTIP